MMQRLVQALIERAMRTPFLHLLHADGSVYMERYWLRPYILHDRSRWAARIHHIATPDWDRDLHDHPWDFVSIVLRGGYVEARPLDQQVRDFSAADGGERCRYVFRGPGSVAYRRAKDRHRIVFVAPDTWTLLISGAKTNSWGFHTFFGKVPWREYESAHQAIGPKAE
jgi:hypothetical protein